MSKSTFFIPLKSAALFTTLLFGWPSGAFSSVSYTSEDLAPHQILRLSFILEEDRISPRFTYTDSTALRAHLYSLEKNPLFEINESDLIWSSFSKTRQISLGTDPIYAWLGFHKPIKHEHAPLKILTHDGVAFGDNCTLTGNTTLVVVPYCESMIESVTFTSIDSGFPMELKGRLSLVQEKQRSGRESHVHGPCPFISSGSFSEHYPCEILETKLLCVNTKVKIKLR